MKKRKPNSQWKWILLGSLGPLAVVIALVATFLLWPRERVSLKNLERVQPGMSRAEVEAILGRAKRCSPGPDEEGIPADEWTFRLRAGVPDANTVIKPTHMWEGKTLTVWAVFDGKGVLDCYTYEEADDDFNDRVIENVQRHMFRAPRSRWLR
jgi:hypothetical protein